MLPRKAQASLFPCRRRLACVGEGCRRRIQGWHVFTGIVEEVGRVVALDRNGGEAVFTIEAKQITNDLAIGASVAVNGVCLTAVTINSTRFTVEAIVETLNRSSLGDVELDSEVNLERAMAVGDRFDGHIVQGHVDGVGSITAVTPEGSGKRIEIEPPGELIRYVVEKGSITVDGISLTVAALKSASFEVALIPHTLEVTTMGERAVGDRLNLEVDILAKYVERLLETRS